MLSARLFIACLVASSPELRWELSVARTRRLTAAERIIQGHLKARAVFSRWCLLQAASVPCAAGVWRWVAGAVS